MKVMILGASGFVGMNVLQSFLQAGIEVVVVGRTASSSPLISTMEGAQYVTLDDVQRTPIKGIDALISFAGVGIPSAFEKDPHGLSAAEFGIADLITSLAIAHEVSSVIYLSTAGAAYGEGWIADSDGSQGRGHVFKETSPCRPVSVYGQIKVAAEARLAMQLKASAPSVKLGVLRASNIYGLHYNKAGQQGLINALVDRWRQRMPITVFGDGLIYRDYLFASDLASALLAFVSRTMAGIFNIGSGSSHSIIDVIVAVETVTGYRFKREHAPARGFDVKYCALSIAKAYECLEWQPQVNLHAGIERVVAHSTGSSILG